MCWGIWDNWREALWGGNGALHCSRDVIFVYCNYYWIFYFTYFTSTAASSSLDKSCLFLTFTQVSVLHMNRLNYEIIFFLGKLTGILSDMVGTVLDYYEYPSK